jgi:NADPH-dependent 2,4-dienoyl-CoA reductase/sulfur reductase-like enzyme
MKNYHYLIIGGGMAAASAVEGIRELDLVGSIGLISAELDAPYNRPPLSKSLWKGKALDSIWRKLENKQVNFHLGKTVKEIDAVQKRVIDDTGNVFTYEKLLLATGGRPRRLPFDDGSIIYFRTLSDYRELRKLTDTETGMRFAVIGGGFIGSEIAAALTLIGKEVIMIFPGNYVGERIFPASYARYLTNYFINKRVGVLEGEEVIGLETIGNQHILKTSAKREISVDGVIAGLGIEPNVELAQTIGLKVENGIVVDEFLRTSDTNIYAAGDVAAFFNPALNKRIRVEHEDNANTMGAMAGRNMTGKAEHYHHLPLFYSDLFDIGYEALGEIDSRLETFIDWKRVNQEGVIYYLQNDSVRGVLLLNVWGKIDAAREIIAEPGPFTPSSLKGRI